MAQLPTTVCTIAHAFNRLAENHRNIKRARDIGGGMRLALEHDGPATGPPYLKELEWNHVR
jgi:hypothetical protein